MKILEGSNGGQPYLNEVVNLSKEDAMNLAKVRSSDNSFFKLFEFLVAVSIYLYI
jgi:hypothetical protein